MRHVDRFVLIVVGVVAVFFYALRDLGVRDLRAALILRDRAALDAPDRTRFLGRGLDELRRDVVAAADATP